MRYLVMLNFHLPYSTHWWRHNVLEPRSTLFLCLMCTVFAPVSFCVVPGVLFGHISVIEVLVNCNNIMDPCTLGKMWLKYSSLWAASWTLFSASVVPFVGPLLFEEIFQLGVKMMGRRPSCCFCCRVQCIIEPGKQVIHKIRVGFTRCV